MENDEDEYDLKAEIDNVRNLTMMLKAVHFKDFATVFGSANGLKVTVEDSKCLQANSFIKSDLFQKFNIKEEQPVTFKISLHVLMECLTIFGTSPSVPSGVNTTLRMYYRGYGSPLSLILEEGGVITDCSIKTLETEDTLDFDFRDNSVNCKFILKSEQLKEALNELDLSSEILQMSVSQDSETFRMSTFGQAGTIHIDFPKGSDVVETFQCSEPFSNKYKMSFVKHSLKALSLSQKISIRVDDRGFLCMQYLMRTEGGSVCFVEFYLTPDEDTEDR